MTSRRTTLALVLGAMTLVCLLPARSVRAERLMEDVGHNFSLTLPEGWADLPRDNGWAKYGVVYAAERRLLRLKTGKAGKGEGGWVHVAITDAPKDKDIDQIAEDPEIRGFLMKRFDADPSKWPEVEVIPADFEEGDVVLPLRILLAHGVSSNLKGKPSPTKAEMLLTVIKGKLIKVRMYAWTTEFDDEGLKPDLDVMEVNFDVIDKTEEKPKQEGPPPELQDDPAEEEVIGDELEEKVFESRSKGWKLTKPIGLASKEWDWNDPAFEDVAAWFEGSKRIGSYQIILYVIRRDSSGGGQNLQNWAFKSWWARFTAAHSQGELAWWRWPKKSKSYLVLPDFEDESGRKVLFKDPKKRPIEAGPSDLIKKLKVAEKVKGAKLGAVKLNEAYRANMEGRRAGGVGREIVLRYTWGTSTLTCMLVVSLTRDAHMKWHKQVNELLQSIEMTKRK